MLTCASSVFPVGFPFSSAKENSSIMNIPIETNCLLVVSSPLDVMSNLSMVVCTKETRYWSTVVQTFKSEKLNAACAR